MNPFQYQKLAIGDNFCGRFDEIVKMKQFIADGQNILLHSERRYGKTSLIKEVFRQIQGKDNTLCIYIDIYDLVTANDFAIALYTGISNSLPFSFNELVNKIKPYFSKVTFDIGLAKDGSPRLTPHIGNRDFEDLIDDALNGLASFCMEKKCRAVIAIDEFQQIAEVKDRRIDALLRKYIQESEHYNFIFCGSKRHLLTSLFTSREAPLFNMASSIQLQGLNPDDLFSFCMDRLDVPIEKNYFDRLYDITRGQTKLIIQFFYHAYYSQGVVNENDFDLIIQRLVDETDGQYRMYYDRIPAQQKRALKVISKYEGRGIYQQSVLLEFGLSKNQLQSAVNKLNEREEIDQTSDGEYYIVDAGFSLWCMFRLHYN